MASFARACWMGAFLTLPAATAAMAAAEPAKGIYSEYQYVSASSSDPSGLSGCNPVGTNLGGYLAFPGPDANGAKNYGQFENSTDNRVQICVYPTTPAAGGTTWSGTETCTDYNFGASNTTFSITFQATLKYVDPNSFLSQRTLTYPTSGGTCTETRTIAYVRTGK